MFPPKLLRAVSRLLIVTLTALALQPLSAAAQAKAQAQPQATSAGERYGQLLQEVKTLTKAHRPGARQTGAELKLKAEQLAALEADVEAEFAATEAHLRAKALPEEIIHRHRAALTEFQDRQVEFKGKLAAALTADAAHQDAALAALSEFMEKHQKGKTHTPTDPKKLPWGTPKPVEREPYTTPAQFQLSRLFHEPVKLAAAGSLSGLGLPGTSPPATPTAEDLAETEDVQLTPAIKAKAEELGKNPVQIYNWVRNTIEYLPTYGSIQGAELTLQTKRGNAFDTASLLIALLRASGIAARYVYGTVEVPADKVMNWVGGVSVSRAAQSLMGQGGIPNIGLGSGGQIKAIRFEHVWVEAFVDYVPSRGAKHREGDTWVPLDASFKQYAYTQGMDLKAAVPVDAQSFLDQAKSGATVNEAEGWVQNLNQANLQSQLTSYQTQVKTYIDAQKPNATVGEVLGIKAIQLQNFAILMGTLPYKTVATGAKMAGLPDNLRWKFRYNVYASDYDRSMDRPMIGYTGSLPRLAGQKITLSFVPATQADLDLINSYLPKPHADGSPIQPSELPKFLPGYLIKLIPDLRVAGKVMARGQAGTMGAELLSTFALFDPAQGWQAEDENRPTAGEYIATLVDGQGITKGQLDGLKTSLTATNTKLEAGTVEGLTAEDFSGDLLYGTILAYFAAGQAATRIGAAMAGVVECQKPSYGSFLTGARVAYWWGIAKQVSFPGLVMDVNHYEMSVTGRDNDRAKAKAHVRQSGLLLSAYEHLIPEKLFTSTDNPGEGVSAVKALAVAASQGQRTYTLTAANLSAVYAIQIDAQARAEIVEALSAGQQVTVHEKPISVNGWMGSGYIILDPDTGAGAYKISGGANGGQLTDEDTAMVALDALADILAHSASAAAKILGEFLGPLLDVLDAIDIWNGCTTIEGKLGGIMALAVYSVILGALLAAVATVGPFFIVILVAILIAITMKMVVETTISGCKRYGQ